LADATLYLEFFGIITIAWQWLLQGIAVQQALNNGAGKKDLNFYEGKMFTLRYFFAYELPNTLGLAERLVDIDAITVAMQTEHFND
jgi:butyryl-CoA dehydrogenase